jgi:hypothetical protein
MVDGAILMKYAQGAHSIKFDHYREISEMEKHNRGFSILEWREIPWDAVAEPDDFRIMIGASSRDIR